MKLPDANVLLSARNADAEHHDPAVHWMERACSGVEPVGFTDLVLLAFLRISTHPSLFAQPLTVTDAFDQIDDWLGAPAAVMVRPGERQLQLMRTLLDEAGTAGNLSNDAHLAAVAIERGATVVSFDTDFHRFPGLEFEHLEAS